VTASPYRDVSPYWTIHSLGEALDRWLLHPVIYPLWFLQALMACMVLSPLVYLAVRALRGWVLVLAAVWWVIGWQPEALAPWISATAFPPFIVGAAIALLGWKAPGAARSAASGEVADGPPSRVGRLAAVVVPAWLGAAALYALYGHELGRWTRAGLLPVVVLGILAVWLGFDALKGALRPPAWLVAAGLFVAPLSFFVYVTQEPALAVITALGRTTYATFAERSGAGAQLLTLVLYAMPPLLVIAGSIGAALALRRLLPRVYAVMTGGRGSGRGRRRQPRLPTYHS
jgi:peptidoglycan/LPS O-acetylase OafA/YrhL